MSLEPPTLRSSEEENGLRRALEIVKKQGGLLQASAGPIPAVVRGRIVQRRMERVLPGTLRAVLLGLAGGQVGDAQLPVL